MNQRIRPADLNDTPYKEVIHKLTLQWVHAELPAEGLTYEDVKADIKILLLTTQSADRTSATVEAVLTQATALGKTSGWVRQELKFEGMIEGADRADFLLFDLQQADTIDDAMLDSYNERMNRFPVSEG
ncbi:hypothetical protein [Spirosoma radiotolerans]|uniref:Uncharacterized protein n=1 Tax=Spirosoma radiotolerans TaxID=1379870 RepID=A0A0E4A179_9BACT|nr:hypothetical protein [Spirosoma radiotolerans]AKD58754.1 hypothetical protein SD10_23635 [Spirosoma radiotolerans]